MKIQKELDESRKTLEDSEARFRAQHEKDASIIRDMEATLRGRLEEVEEMDKHIFGKFSYYAFAHSVFIFLAFFRVLTSLLFSVL